MRDLALIFGAALAAALCVGLVGALVLRLLRGRSITVHIFVLLTMTVAAVVAGVAVVAEASNGREALDLTRRV